MRGALVTGAASGIGAAMSEALVRAGYNVVLFDIAPANATLETLLAIRRHSAIVKQGDARKIEDIRAAINAVIDNFAPFQVLINCAGIGALCIASDHVYRIILRNMQEKLQDIPLHRCEKRDEYY